MSAVAPLAFLLVMRTLLVPICALLSSLLLSFLLPSPLSGQTDKNLPSDLTVLLNLKGSMSPASMKAMEQEADLILKASGFRLSWGVMGQPDSRQNYIRIVVITLRGFCGFDPWLPRIKDEGPLAFTHITDGEVVPFAEVNCGRVAGAVRDIMATHGYAGADQLVGRALGRVVAHELVHILTKSTQHAVTGVQQEALSGKLLVAPDLPLSALDIRRLREERDATHLLPAEPDDAGGE